MRFNAQNKNDFLLAFLPDREDKEICPKKLTSNTTYGLIKEKNTDAFALYTSLILIIRERAKAF